MIDKAAWIYMGGAIAAQYLQTFDMYPPGQRANS